MTVEMERALLIILYSSAPPKHLTEDSLVRRVRVIYPSMTDLETEVRNALNELRERVLCVELPDDAGKLFWSLTEKGMKLLNQGELSTGPQVEAEAPKDRVPTGVPGLDELLAGGVPAGNVILLRGAPGAGKTILAAQFLFAGMTKFSENGVFVSFDVARGPFLRQMKGVGMSFKKFEGERFAFLDAAPIRLLSSDSEIDDHSRKAKLTALNLVDDIRSKTEEINARRLVIDPFTSLTMLYDDILLKRLGTLRFFESLSRMGTTTIITAEASQLGEPRSLTHEEYLSDGVISLQTLKSEKRMQRILEVEKMRETQIDRQPRPYRITEMGVEVYPRESVI